LLEQAEGNIVGEDNLKIYVTGFYKKLFGAPDPTSFSLVEDNIQDIPQLSPLENSILTSDFTSQRRCLRLFCELNIINLLN
jgi:hypothetical protein